MSTSQLLWSMVKRGCARTTGIGALLGAGYGIVLLATAMLSLAQINSENAGFPLFMVLLYVALVAALFGAVVAGVIGFIAGPIGGFLCGLMTHWFFTPLRNERTYRVIAGIAGGLYGVLAIIVSVRLISTSGFAPPIITPREITMLYVFPALIGGVAGIFISQKVTDLYNEVVRGGTSDTAQNPIEAAGHA